jgi:hypothetical protein
MRVDELHTAGASNGEYIFIIANGERQSKQKFLLLLLDVFPLYNSANGVTRFRTAYPPNKLM